MYFILLAATSNKCDIKSLDIKATCLHCNKMERDVFLRLPGDVFHKNEVWKLKRCCIIYELNDVLRAW